MTKYMRKAAILNYMTVAIGVFNIAQTLFISSPLNPLLASLGMVCIGIGAFQLGRESMNRLIQGLQSYVEAQRSDFALIHDRLVKIKNLADHALKYARNADYDPAITCLVELENILEDFRITSPRSHQKQ